MTTKRSHRLLRHMVTDHRSIGRAFPAAGLAQIEQAIGAGERTHRGQVCFAVEGSLPPLRVLRKLTPRDRALEVFGLLRVWDTEENAGVLVFLLLADHDVEIVADRGIHRVVGDEAWTAICARMEEAFRAERYTEGVVQGVGEISALLAQHFPGTRGGANEIPDRPIIL
jgi:uncharacterized membrane protein